MYQEIGIAADRTGEMHVTGQRETEMPDIVGTVFGLRLTAQHDLVDQRRFRGVGDTPQHVVEVARMHVIALRQ